MKINNIPNDKEVFPSDYEHFIYTSRYARWIPMLNRRETWYETVDRYCRFLFNHVKKVHGYSVDYDMQERIFDAIYTFKVMPSMRAVMTAGAALERDNTAGYNCSYIVVDDVVAFDETMYILMCGTGVGFSVEKQYVDKLPVVPASLSYDPSKNIVVEDSKEGWATAYRELIAALYQGQVPGIDVSKVRPAGARLKTFGGRASGPKPLIELFDFTIDVFKRAVGRKLTTLECHDIMCKIGAVVVVGGVRRSAMISLSDLTDYEMATAKSDEWWVDNKHRALANNSVAYQRKPSVGEFMSEWNTLYASHSGERGIFNRQASKLTASRNGRRDSTYEFGTNPCSEIILRPNQFCNLTEAVIREEDGLEQIKEKVKIATILGTLQSTLTYFPYLRPIWAKNTEQERLLGVSLTGIMDNTFMANDSIELQKFLEELKGVAVTTNRHYAEAIGINQSTAVTCIKPSGTVSQLVDSASGIYSRFSHYYIRTVRADNKDPLTEFMKSVGIKHEPDMMNPDNTTIFSFPKKSPANSVMRGTRTAIEQLELWLVYQQFWCEHKPSITVYVREEEWPEVGAWVWNHFDQISGISFLPYDGGTYLQAPYQECDENTFDDAMDAAPKDIDWSKLSTYEKIDTTVGMTTLSCTADACEIVDLVG